MIKENLPGNAEWVYYSSCPRKMVDSMLLMLNEMGTPDERVFKEYFPGHCPKQAPWGNLQ